mmetsp:Transcript_13807/g.29920  ORF Transcript_13807/g.29920 Transcript_13807/m.29920 type:complete len:207 (+) Transcript_13807:1497-2117(+)
MMTIVDGREEMDLGDDEFAPTDEEIAEEETAEPEMMQHAQIWDNYMTWVRMVQVPWTDDADEYHDQRDVEYFNYSMQCSRNLLRLKPAIRPWVPHISCFVVPRQMLWMGDPASRAADSCESYGAMVKKMIKHSTCRHRVRGDSSSSVGPAYAHEHKRGDKLWRQTFRRGYIEQAFRRCCVRESLLHGEENVPFLQRSDYQLKQKGR